jgi:hypothetical protein
VCGVNHFSSTNTKVGKQYQKTELPYIRKDQLTGKKGLLKDGIPSSVKGGKKISGTFGNPKKPPMSDK